MKIEVSVQNIGRPNSQWFFKSFKERSYAFKWHFYERKIGKDFWTNHDSPRRNRSNLIPFVINLQKV